MNGRLFGRKAIFIIVSCFIMKLTVWFYVMNAIEKEEQLLGRRNSKWVRKINFCILLMSLLVLLKIHSSVMVSVSLKPPRQPNQMEMEPQQQQLKDGCWWLFYG